MQSGRGRNNENRNSPCPTSVGLDLFELNVDGTVSSLGQTGRRFTTAAQLAVDMSYVELPCSSFSKQPAPFMVQGEQFAHS